ARRAASYGAAVRRANLRFCQRGVALASRAPRAAPRRLPKLLAVVRGHRGSAGHGGRKGPPKRALLQRLGLVESRQLGSRLPGLAALCLSKSNRRSRGARHSSGARTGPATSAGSRPTTGAASTSAPVRSCYPLHSATIRTAFPSGKAQSKILASLAPWRFFSPANASLGASGGRGLWRCGGGGGLG